SNKPGFKQLSRKLSVVLLSTSRESRVSEASKVTPMVGCTVLLSLAPSITTYELRGDPLVPVEPLILRCHLIGSWLPLPRAAEDVPGCHRVPPGAHNVRSLGHLDVVVRELEHLEDHDA
ncbi:unnamed protein product, partial [Sphacelaria rigidula]